MSKPSEAGDRWPTVVVASSTSFEHGAFSTSDTLGRVVQPRVRAYVLYDRVAELARRFRVDPAAVLGQVIAHEVGHLLFGDEHASTGLMASRIHPGSSFEDPFPGDERPELRAALQFDLAAMAESPVCDADGMTVAPIASVRFYKHRDFDAALGRTRYSW